MKIINTITGETVAEVITNHSMTLDEAINLVGEIITPENPGDADVLIDGNLYFYDDLAMDFTQEKKQEEKKMKNINIERMREKVLATLDHVYETKVYQYWIDSSGKLCRARLVDLDTTAMLEPGAIEVLD